MEEIRTHQRPESLQKVYQQGKLIGEARLEEALEIAERQTEQKDVGWERGGSKGAWMFALRSSRRAI